MRIRTLPKKLKRTLVCIDGANVSIGLRNYDLALDYQKFASAVSKISSKLKVYYYGPKFENAKHQRFLGFLKKLGFKLRTKEVKVIRDRLVDESDGYVVLNEWKTVVRGYLKNHPAVRRGN